jgi:hypothetical protein
MIKSGVGELSIGLHIGVGVEFENEPGEENEPMKTNLTCGSVQSGVRTILDGEQCIRSLQKLST